MFMSVFRPPGSDHGLSSAQGTSHELLPAAWSEIRKDVEGLVTLLRFWASLAAWLKAG